MKNINVDQLIAIIGEKEADKLFLNEKWLLKQNQNLGGELYKNGNYLIPTIPRYQGYSLFYLNSNYFDSGEITNIVIREAVFQDFKNWPKFEGPLDYFYIENGGFMSFEGFDYKVSDLRIEEIDGLQDISYLKGNFNNLEFHQISDLKNIHNENSIKTKYLTFYMTPVDFQKSGTCNIEAKVLDINGIKFDEDTVEDDLHNLGIKFEKIEK